MVNFQFEAPEAEAVSLVGSFNNWDVAARPMKKSRTGFWNKRIKLAPGAYEYRFYVDGRWENDPKGTAFKENSFGTTNNILVVE
jgi:1,4-alpha-glucan branching enzyme